MSDLPEEFHVPLTVGAGLSGGTTFDEVPHAESLDVGELEGDPAVAFRRTMGMFATGVTVITTRQDEQVHGMTANAFMSVSLSPPLVLISIDRRTRLSTMLHEGTRYGVNVLAAHQAGLSDRFAGRPGDHPEPSFLVVHETPLVDGALAHVVARVVRSYWGGDHSLFVGQVEYAHFGEGRPLLFHGGRYEQLTHIDERLAALPPELLDVIRSVGEPVGFAAGERLMSVGDPGDALYVILDGTVSVTRPGATLQLGAGELVGEIAALDGKERTADVVAVTEVEALAVARTDLFRALERDPGIAIALIEVLAGRLRSRST